VKTQTEVRVNTLVSLEAEPPAETSGTAPAGTSRSKWVALAAGVLLSVVLPVLAFQGIDLAQSWRLVLSCRLPELLLAGGFFLVALWARAWRWRFLLAALGQARVRSCLSATCVGFLANNLLPFRLGELVRVRSLRQLEGIRAAKVLGTVAVERIVDILTLVFMLGVYLALTAGGQHQAELLVAGQIALALAFGLALVLALGYWRRQWLQRLIATPLSWISPRLGERASGLAGRFLEGLQVFVSARQVLLVVLMSGIVWGLAVLSCYFVGQALGLGLAAAHYVVIVFTVAFGAVIPAAPGAVGTYHGFARLGLYLVAVQSGEAALAYAVVLHALEWVLVNVTGAYFLFADRLQVMAPRRTEPAAQTPSARKRKEPALAGVVGLAKWPRAAGRSGFPA
jgi:uncharacterized protein (TIRG00374 family)